jgi:hypothetical protein
LKSGVWVWVEWGIKDFIVVEAEGTKNFVTIPSTQGAVCLGVRLWYELFLLLRNWRWDVEQWWKVRVRGREWMNE